MRFSIAIWVVLYNLESTLTRTVTSEQASSTGLHYPEEQAAYDERIIRIKPELRGSRILTLVNNPSDIFNQPIPEGSIHNDEERELFLRRMCGDVKRLFTSSYTCDCTADLLPLQISYSCTRQAPSQVGRAAYSTRYQGAFVVRLLETSISSPVSVCLTDVTYQAVQLERFVPFGNFCIEGTLTVDVDPLQGEVSASVADCNVQFGDIGTCTTCERCPNGGNGFYLDCPSMPGPLCLSNNIPFFGANAQANDRDVFDALGLMAMMENSVNEMVAEEVVAAQEEMRSQQQQNPPQQTTVESSQGSQGNSVQSSTTWSEGKQSLEPPAPVNAKWLEYSSANKPAAEKENTQNNVNSDNEDTPWWVLQTMKGGT